MILRFELRRRFKPLFALFLVGASWEKYGSAPSVKLQHLAVMRLNLLNHLARLLGWPHERLQLHDSARPKRSGRSEGSHGICVGGRAPAGAEAGIRMCGTRSL